MSRKQGWAERGRVDPRPGARKRGYDRRWERASSDFKWRNPLCIGCQANGVERKADLVDHVRPHRGDQTLFWDISNWQPVCDWHHRVVKAELERRYFNGQIRVEELRLTSAVALALTREKYRPAIGADGFAIAGS